MQLLSHHPAILDGLVAFVHHLISEAQGAHGARLPGEELLVERGLVDVGLTAEGVDYFRRALDIKHLFAGQRSGAHHRGHIFALGGERQFAHGWRSLAQGAVVGALCPKPEEQCALGGVAQHLGTGGIGEVKRSGRVNGQSFVQHGFRHVLGTGPEFVHAHLVLRECTCLVRTDDCGRTHRFAGVHLAHQVVGFEHPAHGIGQ